MCSPAGNTLKILLIENLRLYTTSPVVMCLYTKRSPVTNQTVTGSRLTGYIVNVMRSPVIERLMVPSSQVALKHAIHDMVTRTLVMELRRRAIKRWIPCGDMDRRFKIPHTAKDRPSVSGLIIHYNTIQYNTIQYNTIQYNTIQYNSCFF